MLHIVTTNVRMCYHVLPCVTMRNAQLDTLPGIDTNIRNPYLSHSFHIRSNR